MSLGCLDNDIGRSGHSGKMAVRSRVPLEKSPDNKVRNKLDLGSTSCSVLADAPCDSLGRLWGRCSEEFIQNRSKSVVRSCLKFGAGKMDEK